MGHRSLSFGKKVGFFSALSVAGFGAIEGTARVVVPAPLEWRETPSRILVFDSERGWALRPNASDYTVDKPARINSDGFRDREFPIERVPGTKRIVCIGDSYTYGWGVHLEDSYPKQLERRLERTEVLNLGCFGYNARQALATLKLEGLKYRPDVVVYGLYWDDLLPVRADLLEKDETSFAARMDGERSGLLRRFLRRSRALFMGVSATRALVHAISPEKGRFFECYRALLAGDDDSVADLWVEESRAICDMRDAAASVGAKLVVAIWPMEARVYGRAASGCHFDETAKKICDEAGVTSISLLPPLRSVVADGKDPYLPYEQHPTPESYRRCVEVISGRLP